MTQALERFPSTPRQTFKDLLFLGAASVLFCVIGVGAGSLASWDEAMYAQVAKEIYKSGDWINLTLIGSDWYVKPPLFLWATAVFYKLFGVSEFSARLASALSGVGAVLMTYSLGRLFYDRKKALFGALVLLSSTDFLHYARWGTMDIANMLFFAGAIASFVLASRRAAWDWAFWLSASAAFMIKGPVICLAGPLLLLYCAWQRDFGFLKRGSFWAGAVLALALVLPWHIAAYLHNPKGFLDSYIGTHWLARSAGAIEGHQGGWYFYIRTLINKFHPWVVLLPVALPAAAFGAFKQKDAGARLVLIWIAAVLGFFTFFVGTKLKWYILPCYPALALAIGVLIGDLAKGRFELRLKIIFLIVLFLHIPYSSVMVQDYSSGIKEIAGRVPPNAGKNVWLYQYHEAPAVNFYLEKDVIYADSFEELDRARAAAAEPFYLIVPADKYDAEKAEFDRRGLVLVHRSQGPKDNAVLLEPGLL